MVTERKAYVQIRNLTGFPVAGLTTVHRYSSLYEDVDVQQAVVPNGGYSGSFVVRFRTGFGTTGQDWWAFSYVLVPTGMDEHGGRTFVRCRSNPCNLRGLVDPIEKVAHFAESMITFNDRGMIDGTGHAFDRGSTKGFKKHVLREADADRTTTVELGRDGRIHLRTHSDKGNSWINTPCTRENIPLPWSTNFSSFTPPPHHATQDLPVFSKHSPDRYDAYVNQLWALVLASDAHESECCVCLERNSIQTAVRHRGICRAVFHPHCFATAVNAGRCCPFCRVETPVAIPIRG